MNVIYLSDKAPDQLGVAQQVIDWHLAECAVCRNDQPCHDRAEAERVFTRYGRLPRRTPGLTGAGGRIRPGFGWFASP